MSYALRIFVVDDLPPIAHTLSAVLCERGFTATPYTDPLRALQDARSESPDLLITDIEMPRLDGVDLAMQVLARCPNCRVILMSGHVGPIESLEAARAKGLDIPFFSKPICVQTLIEHIQYPCAAAG